METTSGRARVRWRERPDQRAGNTSHVTVACARVTTPPIAQHLHRSPDQRPGSRKAVQTEVEEELHGTEPGEHQVTGEALVEAGPPEMATEGLHLTDPEIPARVEVQTGTVTIIWCISTEHAETALMPKMRMNGLRR